MPEAVSSTQPSSAGRSGHLEICLVELLSSGAHLRIASVGLTAPSVRAPYGTLKRITAQNMSGLKIAAL
jgi:hypothetical protein